ncbi:MAG: hypothetical protein ACRC5T_04605 [Cetobacterium sp.]
MIYCFDSEERLKDIKLHYQQVKELKNNYSEKRSKYRKVASILKFDYMSLERSLKEFEYSLLINCYTFMEQLVKNYIYQTLQKGTHENTHINKFINNKINPEKFSPNVKFENMMKILKEELDIDLNLLISISKSQKEKYNELVKSRHKYAHSGKYDFDFKVFEEVIDLLEYLRFEMYLSIKKQKDYNELKFIIKNYHEKLSKLKDTKLVTQDYLKKIVENFRKDINKAIRLCKILELDKIELLKKIPEELQKVKTIDLRNFEKSKIILLSLLSI